MDEIKTCEQYVLDELNSLKLENESLRVVSKAILKALGAGHYLACNYSYRTVGGDYVLDLNETTEAIKTYVAAKDKKANTKTVNDKEAKWELGDEYYYITFNYDTRAWGIKWCGQGISEATLRYIANGDTNYFRTSESAKKALEEIKEVMRKYE